MGYRHRYEDSYLDDEDEEFDGDERSDADKLIDLLRKTLRSEKENARITKLTERLFVGAKLPGPPGEAAIAGLRRVAAAYAALSDLTAALSLWERLSEVAMAIGNRDLYYQAMDEITNLGPAADEEQTQEDTEY